MDLVIDIGNTLQKLAVFSEKSVLLDFFSEKNLSISLLETLLSQYPIKYTIVSSVREDDDLVLHWLENNTQLIRFTPSCRLPIRIKYATPETLGTDRIANAVGANALYPNKNVLSIMAGTCLVTDFVNDKGEYLGGSISPGVRMRFHALSQFTAHLPFIEPENIDFFIGDNTKNSILAGVMNGIVQEINGIIRQYSRHYSQLKVILSGGDAELLQNSIKKRIFAAQNPVLLGLHKILRLNASKS
ncbi:MAG: type III pantothenate kinase [Bacteroidales bacterium]|nr:type III pantothenate kinase [Bacteroidales bacterium]